MTVLPYNRNKIAGYNPRWDKEGFRRIGIYGLAVTGRAEPGQATNGSTDGSASAITMLGLDAPPSSVFRWSPCIAQVVDWPWSVDDIGVSFDQANLVGIRTRMCASGLFYDDTYAPSVTGEVNWLTAVPRALPAGYTPKGRTGLLPSGISFDFLGDMPLFGPCGYNLFDGSYSQRYAIWREPTLIDGFYAGTPHQFYDWLPSNLSRAHLGFSVLTTWYTTGVFPNTTTYTIAHLTQPNDGTWLRHVGFRGGRYQLAATGGGGPAGTSTIMVGWTEYAVTAPATIAAVNIVWSNDITAATGTQYIGACLAPTPALGTVNSRKNWFLIIKYINNVGGGNFPANGQTYVSPRTDIPAWFTAITGNLIAPGGVIT